MSGNESENRKYLEEMALLLGVSMPTVANWNMIPKGVVQEIAELYEVDLIKGTAEIQLEYLIDQAGLVNGQGFQLVFQPGHSSSIVPSIIANIQSLISEKERLRKSFRAPRVEIHDAWTYKAENKLEAVNRISNITASGPETLGPGSKERKSVLENLYRGLKFGDDVNVTKSELGEKLSSRLDFQWDSSCYSTGESITLTGLNRILAAATRYVDRSRDEELTAAEEASLYSGVILQSIVDKGFEDYETGGRYWDGKVSVMEMVDDNYANARQTEWPGWYFEYKAIPALMKKYGGGPRKYGRTTFDYEGKRTWDLKTHSLTGATGSKKYDIPLNDKYSIERAIAENGGLGFIILQGHPLYDDEEEFYYWHNLDVRGKIISRRDVKSRRLKTGFLLRSLEFYRIPSLEKLEEMTERGVFKDFQQGRQSDGSSRNVKLAMRTNRTEVKDIQVLNIDIGNYCKTLRE